MMVERVYMEINFFDKIKFHADIVMFAFVAKLSQAPSPSCAELVLSLNNPTTPTPTRKQLKY